MPFGLTNAPGTFENLVTLILKRLQFQICLCHLDDIMVFASYFQEHLARLEKVFKRLESAGLKFKPRKCNLLQKETKYLGHVVTEGGVSENRGSYRLADTRKSNRSKELSWFIIILQAFRSWIFNDSKTTLHTLMKKMLKKIMKKYTAIYYNV